MISNLKQINQKLKDKSPSDIINWAMSLSRKRIITTSFGKYSAVLLDAVSKIDENINVIWCDTSYNSANTYEHAIELINRFNLNISIYTPLKTRRYLDHYYGLPKLDDPKFNDFTQIIKIEPFTRALKEHNPNIWFTNIRENQTDYRKTKGILSFSKDGILKVSPFYHWSEKQLNTYLMANSLPINDDYYDITKVLSNRECGIHFQ